VIPLDLEDEDELQSGEEELESEKLKAESASEQVTVRLAFPGNDYVRDTRAIGKSKLKHILLLLTAVLQLFPTFLYGVICKLGTG
jgi:hypothetical protein